MPAVGLFISFAIEPHSLVKKLNFNGSLRAFPNFDPPPTHCCLLLGPLVCPLRCGVAVLSWIDQEDLLIPVDVRHEAKLGVVEIAQKDSVLPVRGIHADTRKAQPQLQRMLDHVQSELVLGSVLSCCGWNSCLLTSSGIVRPALRQKEPGVDQTRPLTTAEGGEYCNLTVIHLADLPAPLPRHSNRLLTLLGNAT